MDYCTYFLDKLRNDEKKIVDEVHQYLFCVIFFSHNLLLVMIWKNCPADLSSGNCLATFFLFNLGQN